MYVHVYTLCSSCHGGLFVSATLSHTLPLFVLCLWALLFDGVLFFLIVFSLLLRGLLHLVVIVRPMKREGVRGRTCRREFGFFFHLRRCLAPLVGSLHTFACLSPSYHVVFRGNDT